MIAILESLLLGPIWKAIKQELLKQAGYQFDKLLSKFRALRSSTFDDVIDCINGPESMRFITEAGLDRIESGYESITLCSVPLHVLASSKEVRNCLAQKLQRNTDLDALRNQLNIDDRTWTDMVQRYAEIFLKHALKHALKRAQKGRVTVFTYSILDIVNEAYPISGTNQYQDIVKLWMPLNSGADFSRTAKMWKARTKPGYRYNKGGYLNKA